MPHNHWIIVRFIYHSHTKFKQNFHWWFTYEDRKCLHTRCLYFDFFLQFVRVCRRHFSYTHNINSAPPILPIDLLLISKFRLPRCTHKNLALDKRTQSHRISTGQQFREKKERGNRVFNANIYLGIQNWNTNSQLQNNTQ